MLSWQQFHPGGGGYGGGDDMNGMGGYGGDGGYGGGGDMGGYGKRKTLKLLSWWLNKC